jgi:hypothetical protein
MNTQSYPGQNLSVSQLVFALNEELKRVAYSPSYVAKLSSWARSRSNSLSSFTFDELSQLDQDASTALTTIREWRNSFVRINRVPLDILSLVPTHLSSQKDRLRASFVCRHWRRTFLHRAELWSQLSLSKGEAYVKTFLGRAKGSALDITVPCGVPVTTVRLLSSHTKQIRHLRFTHNQVAEIQRFSDANPGPLPLLHTIEIFAQREDSDGFDAIHPPSSLLFSNAVNMKAFRFDSISSWSPSFKHYAFPSIVSFDLSTTPFHGFYALELLNFLEASPMLRSVNMCIDAEISLTEIPQERIILLPNVERFTLVVTDGPGYEIAAHISCPSTIFASLTLTSGGEYASPEEIVPTPVWWNAIVHQYTKSPVEEITLKMKSGQAVTHGTLTFLSADETVIGLCFKVTDEDEEGSYLQNETFTQAIGTIRNHPHLANLKRLHIHHDHCHTISEDPGIVNGVGRLFRSLPPLDELSLHRCDLRPYLYSFLSLPQDGIEEPAVFPQIKELTISNPLSISYEECTAIVDLAKSQHARGIPFKRVTVREAGTLVEIEERMRPWVQR